MWSLGRQLAVELWDCECQPDDADEIRHWLRRAADKARATLIDIQVHRFNPHGMSAVAMLAESHIAIHTWPERGYVALDVFTCGEDVSPEGAVEVLCEIFRPRRTTVIEIRRGGGAVSEGWLWEDQAPGVRLGLKVAERLHEERTACQQIAIVATEALGRVLALDGRFMLSESDEAFYHEMLVHPALLSHDAPRRVLIVGGGDGGALRQAVAHPSVEEAVLVEIDGRVVATAAKHLYAIHNGAFDDPRVRLVIAPAEEFVPSKKEAFDAILVDSTDPVGPGKALFAPSFLGACREALREGGVASFQAGSPFYAPQGFADLLRALREIFPWCAPYLGFVPLYPSGLWSYALAGKRPLDVDDAVLAERYRARGLVTRYYTPRVHQAAFILPRFVEDLVGMGA